MQFNDRVQLEIAILKWAAVLLIVKVLLSIVSNYPDFFPPNLQAVFLIGRENNFYGTYQVAFYAHILSTPIAILSGLVLMNQRFRQTYPARHRLIGKWNVAIVLFAVAPSGLWMSARSYTGVVAGAGFASLAIATGLCAAMGWRLITLIVFECVDVQ